MRLLQARRGGPIRRRRSASRSDCATRRKPGATTCTGTSSSTRARTKHAASSPRSSVRRHPATITSGPSRAVEGGRVTSARLRLRRSNTAARPARRCAGACSHSRRADAAGHRDSRRSRRRRTPVRLGDDDAATRLRRDRGAWATGLHQVDNPVFDRARQSVRHLQRIARAGSARLDLPRHARGHARAVRIGHRQCHVDGDRAGRHSSTCRAASKARSIALRDDGTPRAGRVGSRRRLRHRVRFRRLDVSSAIVPARSSACATAARSAFATLPPSVAAFHLAMSPQDELFVSAPTLGAYDHVYRITGMAR